MPLPPDEELVPRLRAGDEAAFAELVDRYDGQVRRLARTFVRTDAQAADVAGETWLAVIAGIDRFEGRSALKTWLLRILVNRASSRAVKEARQVPFACCTARADGCAPSSRSTSHEPRLPASSSRS